jgi:hypothetical protein
MPYDAHQMKRPSSASGIRKFIVILSEAPARRIVGGKNLVVARGCRKLKILAFSAAIAAFFFPLSASAQSCALCYTTVSAAGSAAIRALHFGILAVLIPALTLFLSILFMLFRRAAAEPA